MPENVGWVQCNPESKNWIFVSNSGEVLAAVIYIPELGYYRCEFYAYMEDRVFRYRTLDSAKAIVANTWEYARERYSNRKFKNTEEGIFYK